MTAIRNKVAEYPVASIAVAATVGLVLGAVIGYGSIASEANKVDGLESEVADLQDELDANEQELIDTEASVDEQLEAISEKEKGIYADARARRNSLTQEAKQLEAEVAKKEAKLSDVEGQLSTARDTEAKSSFGDGIWESGTDFIPGTYRAPGGGGCYWALLGSADTSDINNNGGFSKNQLLAIDSPYFETNGCGTWERVGE